MRFTDQTMLSSQDQPVSLSGIIKPIDYPMPNCLKKG